jgi:hypothetical protein
MYREIDVRYFLLHLLSELQHEMNLSLQQLVRVVHSFARD